MKLLLYCIKGKPYLYKSISRNGIYITEESKLIGKMRDKELNSKIVAECDFEVEGILIGKSYTVGFGEMTTIKTNRLQPIKLSERSCLSYDELQDYLKGKNGYSIHIKNLHIFDKPKELSEYRALITDTDRLNDFINVKNYELVSVRLDEYFGEMKSSKILEKAPRNMQKIIKYKANNEYEYAILISIKPENLCKILNGEKTIEVRKNVLKEMLK